TVHWLFVPVIIVMFCIFIYISQCITTFSGLSRRLLYGLGGLSGCYAMAFLFEVVSRLGMIGHQFLLILSNLGKCSLELYCSHIMLNQVYSLSPFYVEGAPIQYLFIAVLSIILSLFVYKIENMINQCRNRRLG
ncbi:MAG: hypothetical protein ACI4B9_03515, partial [Eggerthellaceae bacterium]